MAIKNEFLLGNHQLMDHYVYLPGIFRHLYSQLTQKKLPKENVMYALIQQDMDNQPNIHDISVKNEY